MNDIKVKDVMTNLVVTCRRGDKVQQVARRLLNNRISGAPVVEQGRLVGVISEADLVAAYAPKSRAAGRGVGAHPMMLLVRPREPRDVNTVTVEEVMTTAVVTVSPDAPVWEAAVLIDRHGVRRLPVIDDEGYVLGVIARADLIRAMASNHDRVVTPVA